MKKFNFMRLFISVLVVGGSFCFTACDDDDDKTPAVPDQVTTDTMYGTYSGKMNSISPVPHEGADGEDDKPSDVDISAKVNNDTIYFENFPIKDIVLSFIPDEETADKIVAAVGEVSYKIGYEPTLTAAQDSIRFTLDPKPLKLAVTMPSDGEAEEPQTLVIEVQVEAGNGGGYDIQTTNLSFGFSAAKVLLGEGEDQQELPDFNPITCNFDLNQHKVELTSF